MPDAEIAKLRALTTWERVFWKWLRKGADRSYAVWMADRAESRKAVKREG